MQKNRKILSLLANQLNSQFNFFCCSTHLLWTLKNDLTTKIIFVKTFQRGNLGLGNNFKVLVFKLFPFQKRKKDKKTTKLKSETGSGMKRKATENWRCFSHIPRALANYLHLTHCETAGTDWLDLC